MIRSSRDSGKKAGEKSAGDDAAGIKGLICPEWRPENSAPGRDDRMSPGHPGDCSCPLIFRKQAISRVRGFFQASGNEINETTPFPYTLYNTYLPYIYYIYVPLVPKVYIIYII